MSAHGGRALLADARAMVDEPLSAAAVLRVACRWWFNVCEGVSLTAGAVSAIVSSVLLQYDLDDPQVTGRPAAEMTPTEWGVTGVLATVNVSTMVLLLGTWLYLSAQQVVAPARKVAQRVLVSSPSVRVRMLRPSVYRAKNANDFVNPLHRTDRVEKEPASPSASGGDTPRGSFGGRRGLQHASSVAKILRPSVATPTDPPVETPRSSFHDRRSLRHTSSVAKVLHAGKRDESDTPHSNLLHAAGRTSMAAQRVEAPPIPTRGSTAAASASSATTSASRSSASSVRELFGRSARRSVVARASTGSTRRLSSAVALTASAAALAVLSAEPPAHVATGEDDQWATTDDDGWEATDGDAADETAAADDDPLTPASAGDDQWDEAAADEGEEADQEKW